MRIGVAGLNAAGKGEAVRFLEERSFYAASLSDVIREELRAEGHEPTRDRMIERGRALRERFGPSVLAERVRSLLPPGRNHVIDSIRHPAEVEALRRDGGLLLIWVEAPPEVRFERSLERGRVGTPQTFEAFQEEQARELASDRPEGQQLLAVREMADEIVSNDGDLAAFRAEIQRILESSLLFRERPGWDEYFMNIAHVVASRANCIKRKVGSIIVADRRIISTGYNGTPRGTLNCNEGGCPRCAGAAEAGTRLDECVCSHAEENAITQAAYHGVSLQRGVLYTTFSPCLICTKMIVNVAISEVVYDAPFPLGEAALALLEEAGIKHRHLER